MLQTNEFMLFNFKVRLSMSMSMSMGNIVICNCKCIIEVVGEATKPNVNLILAANKIKFDKYQQHDNMTILRACFERVRNVMFTSGWLLIWCWHLQVMFSMFNKLLICLCLADLLFLVSNLAVSPVAMQVAGTVSTKMGSLNSLSNPRDKSVENFLFFFF